jgi:hypothetical protein
MIDECMLLSPFPSLPFDLKKSTRESKSESMVELDRTKSLPVPVSVSSLLRG